MIWPDGSPGKLRAAAEAWTTAGSAFLASEAQLLDAVTAVAGQHIPEGQQITQAVVAGNDGATALFGQCVRWRRTSTHMREASSPCTRRSWTCCRES